MMREELDPEGKVPLYVDGIENQASVGYRSVPERLFVVLNGKFIYVGGPGPFGYDLK